MDLYYKLLYLIQLQDYNNTVSFRTGSFYSKKKNLYLKITFKAFEMKTVIYPPSNRFFRSSSLSLPYILFVALLLSPTTTSQTTDNTTETSYHWNIFENVSMSTVSIFQHWSNLVRNILSRCPPLLYLWYQSIWAILTK